jgi:hypothetical protein
MKNSRQYSPQAISHLANPSAKRGARRICIHSVIHSLSRGVQVPGRCRTYRRVEGYTSRSIGVELSDLRGTVDELRRPEEKRYIKKIEMLQGN